MMTWGAVWVSAGAIAFVFNLHVHYQRLSGRLGTAVQDSCRRVLALTGGPVPLFWTIVLVSFLMPPVALVCCLVSYRRDWEIYKLEEDSTP